MKSKNRPRQIDPSDIVVPPGYEVDVYADCLTTPINLVFTDLGNVLIADAGVADGNGKVLGLTDDGFQVIADGFNPPLTGINVLGDDIYVSHRGFISVVHTDGTVEDVLAGLPSWGDHHNNRVVFGPDGKMYFGQGTATNSGVVGPDNRGWVKNYPFLHDYPGEDIGLVGRNYESENFLTIAPDDIAVTGGYSPFAVPTIRGEEVKGIIRASGSILRANPDGSELELVAWGLRNPFRMKFDRNNRLYSTNHGMDVRGSRPVANSPDEFYLIKKGCWYGWPDFTGGLPVTLPRFKPEDDPQPKFLLSKHPMEPPEPLAVFEPHAAVMGFDFNYNRRFGQVGDVYIAEFGSEAPRTTGGKPLPGVGHRVSRINMKTGKVIVFAINKSGYAASYTNGGGFERPIDAVFGPDKALYVVDFGMTAEAQSGDHQDGHEEGGEGGAHEHNYLPRTGLIWRIRRI
ncbi:Quinoprotein glucose dehydrogenase B precursor [Sporomusa ovata DSM 2662]|uniref:Probable lipoprotein n=1 Tax=Sporomusa ovata TaxID=2378 RepID=A0A0U1L282_9FIRM|nr:PQQ-dependent sugar dehydrogenase [Sporomusa ovata]EQB25223.1 glucose/sorbosone dehydrogenase [Sporomusa ovata DSM 2662]CQR73786.1 Probable lipoprotein [Sporomusa ovata]